MQSPSHLLHALRGRTGDNAYRNFKVRRDCAATFCCSRPWYKKVRITGGEPLVRKGLPSLIKAISNIKGIEEISLTTNGVLLRNFARELKEAGLKRLNISLDSMNPNRYEEITRGNNLADVWEGIKIAEGLGFSPSR